MIPKHAARAVEITHAVGSAAWVVVDDTGAVPHQNEAEARRVFNRAKVAATPRPVYLYRVVRVGATFARVGAAQPQE